MSECDHDWDFVGGLQCWNDKGGREPGYFCSRPVYQCTKCLAHDNGQSEVADDHCSKCPGSRPHEVLNGVSVEPLSDRYPKW